MAVFSGVTKKWMQEEVEGRYHNNYLLVQSGLIASYDAGISNNATTLVDLKETYNATVYNGAEFSSQQYGVLLFDGTNDFVKTPSITNFAMICIFGQKNDAGLTRWRYLLDARPGKGDGYIAIGMGGWNLYLNGANGVANSWDSIPTDQWFYLCADARGTFTSTINIMSRTSNNETLPGKIGSIQIYNRVLSESEMNYNYSTLRSRFGV